jgi:hypothetical protein
MKYGKILVAALVVVLFSASAWADQIGAPDPTVILKKGGGSPTTNWGYDRYHPIYIIAGVTDFKISWSGTYLYIELVPALVNFGQPAEVSEEVADAFTDETYNCQIDPSLGAGASCSSFSYAKGLNNNNNPYSGTYFPGFEVQFVGNFIAGEDLQTVVAVPEPNSLLLLLFGMLAATALLVKRQALSV